MSANVMPQAKAILVVEDEPVLRYLIVEELEAASYDVFEAKDAPQAMTLLETQPDIRLVVTDIDLSSASEGMKLARLIRDRWPPIRIILTSSNWSFTESDLPFAERFIPKPHAPGALLESIRTCLV